MMSAGTRSLIALSIVLTSAMTLHPAARRAQAYRPSPAPAMSAARCLLRGMAARTHGRALEQRAILHWQRAPFEAPEATRATQLIAEAEVCYRAAADRAGAQRAASLHRGYAAETSRRDASVELARARTDRRRVRRAWWADRAPEVQP